MPATHTPSSDLLSYAGRAAHDIGMAGLFGGQLFGRVALHPAVTRPTARSRWPTAIMRLPRRPTGRPR
jgi:hypothetical protein